MILVDTSVLINYLREVKNDRTVQFAEILKNEIPFCINNYIYQELLQGCRNVKDFRLLKKYLDSQEFGHLKNGRESYANAARLYFNLRRQGITIRSSIDCIIVQMAIENDFYLLHDDVDFSRMSQVLPVKIWGG